MKRVTLYKENDVIEVHEYKAPKMISAGWSEDKPKKAATKKVAKTKTETETYKDE